LLFVDDALLVVCKPAGLLAVPGRGEAGADNLLTRLQAVHADARVVHRLDMATSGLMVFARGAPAQRALSMAFEARRVGKQYEAIVEGAVSGDAGEISAPLGADWPNRPRQQVDAENGKPSLTAWRVLQRHDGSTRLALTPVTGRTHQLRVHLQHIGHPIRGDALYAAPPLNAERLLLHATQLNFNHPSDGTPLSLRSPAPF
jgi:tRNA pseudouridine32 synthase/23S rRNA pseudouridine746 synthase